MIDTPEKVMAAAAAMEALNVPPPNVALNVGVRTGGQPRVMGPVNETAGFPYPTRYLPPRVPNSVVGPGLFPVLPAHPTGFVTRNVGDTMVTTPAVNPDGSITLDVNLESTEFEGFINYGSPILRPGVGGRVPLLNRVRVPRFLDSLIESEIGVPVFDTIRYSTSVTLTPEVAGGRVFVDVVPEMSIVDEASEIEPRQVDLSEYRTVVEVESGKPKTLAGLEGASAEFNRAFFADENQPDGETALVIKAQLQPGAVEAEAASAVGAEGNAE
ncbi:MAG: hypothetical protein AAGD22_09675 [Verrucomicrobiota bacterium]